MATKDDNKWKVTVNLAVNGKKSDEDIKKALEAHFNGKGLPAELAANVEDVTATNPFKRI